jgi:ATP-dependent helicase/nuclease subunit A
VAFDARIAPEIYDARTVAMDNRDVILIRGVIDLILSTPQGIEIIDYKTDQLAHASRESRINAYRPQLDIYARAMEEIYRARVTHRWLVFLDARMIALVGAK